MKIQMSVEQLKEKGVPSVQRIFYMLHGHFDVSDYRGISLSPDDTVAYAVGSTLKRGRIDKTIWVEDRVELVLKTKAHQPLTIDPKRCVKL